MKIKLIISILLIVSMGFVFQTKPKSKPTKKTGKETKENKEKVIEITTQFGSMYIWLFKATPLHRANFIKLTESKFYDSTTFHRVIPGFMIQGGDPNSKDNNPNNDGQGGPDYTIPAEFVDSFKHDRGMIAAARMGDQVNPKKASSGSQFYICSSKEQTHFLDGQYTVFGYVMKGMNVLDSIEQQKVNYYDRPYKDIKMTLKTIEKTKSEIIAEYHYVPR